MTPLEVEKKRLWKRLEENSFNLRYFSHNSSDKKVLASERKSLFTKRANLYNQLRQVNKQLDRKKSYISG